MTNSLTGSPRYKTPGGGALAAALLVALCVTIDARGQINSLSREELIKYTAQNPYDRFPDGRPKVPDAVLGQLKDMSSEEVMSAGVGGPNQYADGWQILKPGKKLIGRALTLQLMPTRPEVADVDLAAWKAKGNAPGLSHQSALDMLQPGDVIVVDAFGSIAAGGIIGDNLAYYIWKKTGTGFVIDGAIRDLEGVADFDLAGYFRGATPPAIRGLMVTGINVPVRIGNVTVMPGDVVFGDREGVTFIPPHQVQGLIDTAKITHIHDEWTRKKFDEGKYRSTDIYGRPRDPALIQEYEDYLKQKLGPQAYDEYRKRRQAGPPAQPVKPPAR
jgi:4-hydroxy-4-methyl-2-oxoglutarate aldolase